MAITPAIAATTAPTCAIVILRPETHLLQDKPILLNYTVTTDQTTCGV